jgi:aspartate 1-decarboxylase
MKLNFLKAKIHSATVTKADLNYEGSISIDEEILKKSSILPNEKVDVLNVANGERFSTYTIVAPKNSGEIQVNGAAARLVQKGDKIIIISYCIIEKSESKNFKPNILILGENNKIQTSEQKQ